MGNEILNLKILQPKSGNNIVVPISQSIILINPSLKEYVNLQGGTFKFIQTTVPLKSYCSTPTLYSNIPEPYNITQDGNLIISVDGTPTTIPLSKSTDQNNCKLEDCNDVYHTDKKKKSIDSS